MTQQQVVWLTLVASVLVALGGAAELLPHPYHNVMQVLGTIGTAISGVLVKLPSTK